MTIEVEISPELEARLAAEANARGVAPEKYAETLLQEALTLVIPGTGKLTRDDFRAMTKELQEGSQELPVLPPEATERSSFYRERL